MCEAVNGLTFDPSRTLSVTKMVFVTLSNLLCCHSAFGKDSARVKMHAIFAFQFEKYVPRVVVVYFSSPLPGQCQKCRPLKLKKNIMII